MIHVNLIEETEDIRIARMPAAEFCGRGNLHEDSRFIFEVEVSPNFTLVLDEPQLAALVEKALDAMPPQFDGGTDEDKGGEWKGAAS